MDHDPPSKVSSSQATVDLLQLIFIREMGHDDDNDNVDDDEKQNDRNLKTESSF